MTRHITIDDREAIFLAGRLIQTRDLLLAARSGSVPLLTLVSLLQHTHDELRERLNDRILAVLMGQGVQIGRGPFDLAIEQAPIALTARLAAS